MLNLIGTFTFAVNCDWVFKFSTEMKFLQLLVHFSYLFNCNNLTLFHEKTRVDFIFGQTTGSEKNVFESFRVK